MKNPYPHDSFGMNPFSYDPFGGVADVYIVDLMNLIKNNATANAVEKKVSKTPTKNDSNKNTNIICDLVNRLNKIALLKNEDFDIIDEIINTAIWLEKKAGFEVAMEYLDRYV